MSAVGLWVRRASCAGLFTSLILTAVFGIWWQAGAAPLDAGTAPLVQAERAPAPVAAVAVARPRVDTHPARLETLPARASVAPVGIRIESAGIAAPVVAVGVGSAGEMVIPPDPELVAWYEHGPSPGESGSAVLAAHVDFDGRPGVFFRLATVEVGSIVIVDQPDGSQRRFTVTGRREYAKPDLPVAELFSRGGPPTLALVTCGGSFDRAAHSYRANVVVYAVLA